MLTHYGWTGLVGQLATYACAEEKLPNKSFIERAVNILSTVRLWYAFPKASIPTVRSMSTRTLDTGETKGSDPLNSCDPLNS